MSTVLRWTFQGAFTGAALFGVTVAVLGGATASLLLFFWGAGIVVQAALARRERRDVRSPEILP